LLFMAAVVAAAKSLPPQVEQVEALLTVGLVGEVEP
jgi:hypothetical protein